MALVLTPNAEGFLTPTDAPQVVQIAGGIAPYTAVSSNTAIATVSAVTAGPNLYTNSDTLSSSTLTGLTNVPTGSPGGHASAEYTGTGGPAGANKSLTQTQSVTQGATCTLSHDLDTSQVTNLGSNVVQVGINDVAGNPIVSQFVTSAVHNRYAPASVTIPTNLCPFSDLPSAGWFNGGLTAGTLGPNGAASFSPTTSGGGQYRASQSLNVTVGQVVTLSGFIDATGASSGSPGWFIYDDESGNPASLGSQLKAVTQTHGVSGRVSGSYTVAAGVTKISILAYNNSAVYTVAPIFSQPMVELRSSASGYYISSTNPQVQLYAQLLSSGIVTSGQKFKISQPMLRTDGVVNPYSNVAGSFTLYPVASGYTNITVTDSTP